MIFDTLDRLPKYKGIHPHLDKAIDYLTTHNLEALTEKTEVDGENVYLMPQSPTLVPFEQGKWEAHHRYADIQIALVPGETMEYIPANRIEDWTDYQEDKDCKLSFSNQKGISLSMAAHTFVIFFPQEPHKPCLGEGKTQKIVVKVKM